MTTSTRLAQQDAVTHPVDHVPTIAFTPDIGPALCEENVHLLVASGVMGRLHQHVCVRRLSPQGGLSWVRLLPCAGLKHRAQNR